MIEYNCLIPMIAVIEVKPLLFTIDLGRGLYRGVAGLGNK